MLESCGSMRAQSRSSRCPEQKKKKRKGEREKLAKMDDGSEDEIR